MTRSRPALPISRRSCRVAGEPLERAGHRVDVADRDEEAVDAVARPRPGTPPTRVATTGAPGGERLDRHDGRALVRRRQEQRVEEARSTARRRAGSRRRACRARSPSSCARRSTARGRARRRRGRAAPRRPAPRSPANAASTSGTRLIAVIRPIQPTTNASGGHAEERAAAAARRPRRSVIAAVEVDPEPDHGELLRRARRRARRGRRAPRG